MIRTDAIYGNHPNAPAVYWKHVDEPITFSRIELYTLNPIRLDVPFVDSTGGPFHATSATHWLVLWDENNMMGQAPCTRNMEQFILPFLRKGETKKALEWFQDMYWGNRNLGFASNASVELGRFDMALHDLLAKRVNLPLHRFLGATRDWVNVYASAFGTNLTDRELEAEAEFFINEGYTTFKVKSAANFGENVDKDIKRLEFIGELLHGYPMAIDVNQLWDAHHAIEFAKRIEHLNIAWFEEPVNSYDIRGLEELTSKTAIPIAMGESMRNYHQFYPYIKAGVKHLQPIPDNIGGIRDWMNVRDQAINNELTFTAGGFSHQTAAYLATAREEDMVEYLYPLMSKIYEILDVRPEEKEGKFILPDEIGSSARPDFNMLDKLGYIGKKEVYRLGK